MRTVLALFIIFSLICPFTADTGTRARTSAQASAMAPYLQTASRAADDYVQYSLNRFPVVLDQERFSPKRYEHIKAVIKSFYYFKTRNFEDLYNNIPHDLNGNSSREEYMTLLGRIYELYEMLSPEQQTTLETAIILHDIGYPDGTIGKHPQRGMELARQILPQGEQSENVARIISAHGIFADLGTYWFSSDLVNMQGHRLTDEDRISLLLICIFDEMGKADEVESNQYIIKNRATHHNILKMLHMLADISYSQKIFTWYESIEKTKFTDFFSMFWLYRISNSFSPPIYNAVRTKKEIRDVMDEFVGPEQSLRRGLFIRYWNSQIRISTWTIFINLHRRDNFKAIVKLAYAIAATAENSGKGYTRKPFVFESDIDYMNKPTQKVYEEHFQALITVLDSPDWEKRIMQMLEYDSKHHTIILQFNKLDPIVQAQRNNCFRQAA